MRDRVAAGGTRPGRPRGATIRTPSRRRSAQRQARPRVPRRAACSPRRPASAAGRDATLPRVREVLAAAPPSIERDEQRAAWRARCGSTRELEAALVRRRRAQAPRVGARCLDERARRRRPRRTGARAARRGCSACPTRGPPAAARRARTAEALDEPSHRAARCRGCCAARATRQPAESRRTGRRRARAANCGAHRRGREAGTLAACSTRRRGAWSSAASPPRARRMEITSQAKAVGADD